MPGAEFREWRTDPEKLAIHLNKFSIVLIKQKYKKQQLCDSVGFIKEISRILDSLEWLTIDESGNMKMVIKNHSKFEAEFIIKQLIKTILGSLKFLIERESDNKITSVVAVLFNVDKGNNILLKLINIISGYLMVVEPNSNVREFISSLFNIIFIKVFGSDSNQHIRLSIENIQPGNLNQLKLNPLIQAYGEIANFYKAFEFTDNFKKLSQDVLKEQFDQYTQILHNILQEKGFHPKHLETDIIWWDINLVKYSLSVEIEENPNNKPKYSNKPLVIY